MLRLARSSGAGEASQSKGQQRSPEGSSQIAIGDFVGAVETVQAIPEEAERARGLVAIAEGQLSAGQAVQKVLNDGLESVRWLPEGEMRSQLLSAIAAIDVRVGDFAHAIAAAQEISRSEVRTAVLTAIAQAQIEKGSLREAIDVAQTIPGQAEQAEVLVTITKARVEAGDLIGAVAVARTIPDESLRDEILTVISRKLMTNGDLTAAIDTACTISSDVGQAELLTDMAQLHAGKGDFASAVETARAIRNEPSRELALALIPAQASQRKVMTGWTSQELLYDESAGAVALGRAQTELGYRDAARSTFEGVLERATKIQDPFSRAVTLVRYAEAFGGSKESELAATGLSAALDAAREIEADSYRNHALVAIARTQARTGLGKQAIRTAEDILTERGKYLPQVASSLVDGHDLESLRLLMIPCAYYLDAAYELCGLLARVFPEQSTKIARIVIDQVWNGP